MKSINKKTNLTIIATAIFASTIVISCSSPSQKVENADANVTEAKQNLAEAQYVYAVEVENFKKETVGKITSNEKIIADIKESMANEKKEAKAVYQNQITALEQKNADLKNRIDEYKEDGNEKWQSFKREFNHDMDELGQSLKEFLVEYKK